MNVTYITIAMALIAQTNLWGERIVLSRFLTYYLYTYSKSHTKINFEPLCYFLQYKRVSKCSWDASISKIERYTYFWLPHSFPIFYKVKVKTTPWLYFTILVIFIGTNPAVFMSMFRHGTIPWDSYLVESTCFQIYAHYSINNMDYLLYPLPKNIVFFLKWQENIVYWIRYL